MMRIVSFPRVSYRKLAFLLVRASNTLYDKNDKIGSHKGNTDMGEEQFGFDLGEQARADKPLFDPDEIREDCLALIAEARRNGPELIWDAETLKYNRIVFPHLASWIPDEEERAQLCFAFTQEADRIELLLAA